MLSQQDDQDSNQDEYLKVKLKKKLDEHHLNFYVPDTFSRGLMSHYDDGSCEENGRGHEILPAKTSNKKEEKVYVSKRKKKDKRMKELVPFVQPQKKIVYLKEAEQNATKVINLTDKEQNMSNNPIEMKSKVQIIPVFSGQSEEKPSKRCRMSYSEEDIEVHEPFDQLTRYNTTQAPCVFDMKLKDLLLFDLDFDSQQAMEQKREEFIDLPVNKLVKTQFYSSEEDQVHSKKQISEPKKYNVISKKWYFEAEGSSISEFKREMSRTIKDYTMLQMILERNKDLFNVFWPEFYLKFQIENEALIAAKKVSSQPFTTYVISTNSSNFEENSEFYLGKLKSNLLGDIINLFGPGLNPTDAKLINKIPRELLATIIYSKMPSNKPREFEVFVKRPEYRYYLNFHQVAMYEQETPLNELYKFPQNRQKIQKYSNRKPHFNKDRGEFILNFHGRAECTSIKNFILQKEQNGPDLMMLAKINDSHFNIEISSPLSPLIGFAIALTSFDARLLLGS